MRWSVVVEHQVDCVALRGDKDDLERCVPEGLGRISPEQIDVAGDIDSQVEELRFEAYAGRGL